MANWKRIGKKLLFPPVWLVILLAVLSAAALSAVFLSGWAYSSEPLESGLASTAYALSAYTLTVVCAACASALPESFRKAKQKIYSHPIGKKYITDIAYRTHLALNLSFGINLLYAAFHLYTGILYRSVWSATLAVYYIILASTRFLLLRFVGRVGIGHDRIRELRRSRLCGFILMTVNLALGGVVVLVIVQNKGFSYNGMMIYVMALYTFYTTTNSAVSIFRYKKYNSPVLSTAKSISLAAALVSMLSLTTAMLSRFGDQNDSPDFSRIMVGATGAGVCALVLTMSLCTIVRSNMDRKKLRPHHERV